MSVRTLIDDCQRSGVAVRMDGGALKLKGAADAVKAAADRLRPHKAELLEYLAEQAANDPCGLVREFMDVDGLNLADAQALAAISIQPRSANEWLGLIAELDALIDQYCTLAKLTDKARVSIIAARFSQSLTTLPATLEWFRREIGTIPRPVMIEPITESTRTDGAITSRRGTAEKSKG